MVLSTTQLGEHGSWVVFCHGLFGQGKNWTTIGRALADRHRVLLVDMPDHGASPRSERFDYLASADAVAELLEGLDGPRALVGHSMGGKVAMLVALRRPELVERLVVVDVSPVPYDHSAEFERYISAMRAIDLTTLRDRAQADAALVEAVPSPMVRGFLLQSLRREGAADGGGWRWLLNLDLLGRDLDAITGWPESFADLPPYAGPVLWVGGAESAYVGEANVAAMDHLFPHNRRVTVKNAGHWVHSEQPAVFVEVLRRFLDARTG
jgi:pimeloyl-ACP methyl ester carboxylesterase